MIRLLIIDNVQTMNIGFSGPYGYVPQKLPIKTAPEPEQSYYKQVLVVGGGWDALQ